jgi:iron complex transport system substrate-binding protein
MVALALLASACGGPEATVDSNADPAGSASGPERVSESGSETATSGPDDDAAHSSSSTHGPVEQPESIVIEDSPLDIGRVVALGEDELLADLLAMGVTPVFSTTNGTDGFVGIERDTLGIEFRSSFDLSPEELWTLDADLLIVGQSFIDLADAGDLIDGLADEVVVLQADDWRDRVRELADALGVPERGDGLLGLYDRALAEARGVFAPGLTVSVASVYDFAFAAWVDAPAAVPATLLDLGLIVSPGGGEFANEAFGRIRPLSDEQLTLLDGDVLLLLQNLELESESDALAAAEDQPVWRAIPAVAAGRVAILDRVGFQGVEGRIRLIGELVKTIEELA